ncbi:MAG: hypothetical protein ACYTHM_18290 [Planctomycetota bacterium]|jgi:hypothetical protein
MEGDPDNLPNLREIVTPAQARILQLIYAAIALGILVFAAVVIVIYLNYRAEPPGTAPPGSSEDLRSMMDLMSLVHGMFGLSTIPLALVLFGILSSRDRLLPPPRSGPAAPSTPLPTSRRP